MSMKSFEEMKREYAEMFKKVYGFEPTSIHPALKEVTQTEVFNRHYKRIVAEYTRTQFNDTE